MRKIVQVLLIVLVTLAALAGAALLYMRSTGLVVRSESVTLEAKPIPPAPESLAAGRGGPAMTTSENPAARLADLTCQPQVDPDTAPRATYLGKAYYFCTAADRDLFQKAPAKYLQR